MKQKSSLKDRLVGSRYFSFGITLSLFVLLYVVGMMNYRGFMKPQVFCNLLIDNAALIIATIGITFVLLIGGIDISIGSVVALTCMSSAQMLQNTGARRHPDRAGHGGCVRPGPGLADYGIQHAALHCHAGGAVLRPRHDGDHLPGDDCY